MQHVGAGQQQESRAAYRWSNGMEKFSTDTLLSIITTQALSGCQNNHYTTEKGKASALRELIVARSEALHNGGFGGGGGGGGGGGSPINQL